MHRLVEHLSWYSAVSTALDLLRTLAWPLTVVTIAVLFRTELRQIMLRVSKLKYRDFEAEFREELRQAEGLRKPEPTPAKSGIKLELNRDPMPEEYPLSPRETIKDAWLRVERKVLGEPNGPPGLDPVDLVQFERLRSLARMVDRQHDWHPSWDAAERFRGLSRSLSSRLGSA